MPNLKRHLTEFSSVYITQTLFNISFYGIRSIFVLYAVNRLLLNDAQAISFFATFMTLCYGTSLIGGYIADKGWGVKNTVMAGGTLSASGFLCILLPSPDLFFLGLALASLGSGYFKPNLLTAAGLLFENPKDPQKERVYSFLYMAMNLGALIAPVLCGFVGKTWGWHYGIMLIALIFTGATYFVHKTMRFHPSYNEIRSISKGKLFWGNLSLVALLYCLFKYQESFHSLMGIITCGSILCLGKIYYQCNPQERKDVLTIIAYILLFALFCTLFEQEGTSLMLFFEKAVDRQIMGAVIPSSSFLSLGSLFVLICSPFLLFLSSQYFEKAKPMNGFVKTGWGFLCVAASFGILAFACQVNGASIPFLWIVGAIFMQVIGELWVAPVSFSKISQYAPPRFKSILMSFWSMAIAYGHYLAGFVAQLSLNNRTSLSLDNSFEGYRMFFLQLGIFPLCVGLSLLSYQAIKSHITSRKRRIS